MPTTTPRPTPAFQFQHVVLPVDFTDCSERALPRALSLAERAGATLTLLHVLPPVEVPDASPETAFLYEAWQRERLHARLDRLRLTMRYGLGTRNLVIHTAVVPHADPAEGIVAFAHQQQADLIVMGTHSQPPRNAGVLGSVAHRVSQVAPCPVLTVPTSQSVPGSVRRVLLPLTPHVKSRQALRYASDLATLLNSTLTVLCTPAVPVRNTCEGGCCASCLKQWDELHLSERPFNESVQGWVEQMRLPHPVQIQTVAGAPAAVALQVAHNVATDLVILPPHVPTPAHPLTYASVLTVRPTLQASAEAA